MSDPKYAYPYPAQGYYQGPPVVAPPQYAAPPPRREPGFLEGWLWFMKQLLVRKVALGSWYHWFHWKTHVKLFMVFCEVRNVRYTRIVEFIYGDSRAINGFLVVDFNGVFIRLPATWRVSFCKSIQKNIHCNTY
ncbi:hypothetical protein PVK06_005933 [Gossypium arboreum]|uniref:Uncharacterized protein n=1 Tax=Gossypium arboreum TaxID=29729 RepID=A0ABR0QVX1_GOSAR|nr:hypothetical protein PVK06_005933 [Gossypium arboreum]